MIPARTPPFRPSRRGLLALTAAGLATGSSAPPLRAATPDLPLTDALRARRSTRAFAAQPIAPALLAELLWAAFGINRPDSGLHTAPSWRGAADVTVHVATADGVLAHDPARDETTLRLGGDTRGRLSPQPFVATAPAVLILVSDLRRLQAAGTGDERRLWAHVDAAMVAQNVYLFAAARGLGTCLVGGLDRDGIGPLLGLAPHEFVTYVQPVGWPA
jgi:nitroreductase